VGMASARTNPGRLSACVGTYDKSTESVKQVKRGWTRLTSCASGLERW